MTHMKRDYEAAVRRAESEAEEGVRVLDWSDENVRDATTDEDLDSVLSIIDEAESALDRAESHFRDARISLEEARNDVERKREEMEAEDERW